MSKRRKNIHHNETFSRLCAYFIAFSVFIKRKKKEAKSEPCFRFFFYFSREKGIWQKIIRTQEKGEGLLTSVPRSLFFKRNHLYDGFLLFLLLCVSFFFRKKGESENSPEQCGSLASWQNPS